ncbi:uncharacterized protein LOC143219079 [Lasioglossum baleicum]|uniref:uncharacterized protein LOC143219079 n=1 Tax=Lasioglossum baleicum TaxID=434251 RepID=UPI003FCC3DEF
MSRPLGPLALIVDWCPLALISVSGPRVHVLLALYCFVKLLKVNKKIAMVARRCMVHNCPGNYTSLHKFPSDRKFENRLFIWLSASGNQELLHLPKNSLLQRGICNIHFEAKYFLQRGLSVSAVPTLYLPDPIEIPLDHYTRVESEGGTNDGSNSSRAIYEPSTSLSDPIEIPLDHYTHVESEGGTNDGSNSSRAIPSTSESNHFTEGVQMKRNRKRCREENAGTAVSTKIRRKEHSLCCISMRQEMKENNPFGNTLKKENADVAPFPPKRVRNCQPKVLEQRRAALELYTQKMLRLSATKQQVLNFLGIESRTAPASHKSTYKVPEDTQYDQPNVLGHHPVLTFRCDPYAQSNTSSSLPDIVINGVLQGMYEF